MDKQDIVGIYPLTATQQGMLFHALSEHATTAYVEQVSRRLPRCEPEHFTTAWRHVVAHYDALRTAFHWEAIDRPVQIVRREVELTPRLHDWSDVPSAERESRLKNLLQADRAEGFDLAKPPLMRLTLITWSTEESVFVWTYHHTMLDGWSAFRVIDEVLAAYASAESGKSFRPAGPPAFKPYVTWLRERDAAGDEAFWREYLRGFHAPTPLNLDLDTPWRADSATGPTTLVHDMRDGALNEVRDAARRNHVTVNTYIQATWAWLLSRHSGDSDVVFGTTVSGRPPELPGCESMVGLFINTLPERVKIDPGQTVLELLQAIQNGDLRRREHEYASLVQVQGWSSLPQGSPMFNSLLAVESFPSSQHFALNEMHVVQETNYTVALVVEPNRELRLRALFNADHTSPQMVQRLLKRFEMVLAETVRRPAARVSELPFALPDEINLQMQWNQTAHRYAKSEPISARLERLTNENPHRPAVFDGDQRLSYGYLLQRADRLAACLQAYGARAGDVVAMLFAPSVDMIVAAVGIVRAGCAYAPLDPTQPPERLSGILADLRPALLVSHRNLADQVELSGATGLIRMEQAVEVEGTRRDPGPVNMSDLVYVMHTSGSTGKPKAAAVFHHSFVNLMAWWTDEFELGVADRVLLVNKISFDLLQKNFWGALCTGGEVHVLPDVRYDPMLVRAWIREHKITWMNCTPSMAYALLDDVEDGREDDYADFASLRYLMLGGEPVQKARFAKWQKSPNRRTEIVNTYGPTECADLCAVHRFAPAEFAEPNVPVTVGKTLPNIRLYVIDDHLRPQPPFVLGEVVIGGASIGAGYLNNAQMTAEKFFPDVIGGAPGARLYRTGDIGYFGPDGQLYVRGRVDFQIKLRGQRIELEEIDAIARGCPWVREAVTVLGGHTGDQLICYVTLTGEAPSGWRTELRTWLARQLSAGLVPNAYVALDALPLNDNGKVNRGALPALQPEDAIDRGERVAPRDDIESKLAQIWATVLNTDQFGVTDNFFELGGHSLSITQVFSRLPKVFGVRVALGDLFSHATIEEQARLIAGGSLDDIGDITPQDRPARIPLSSSQARFWFLQSYEPENPAYNVPSVIRFSGVDQSSIRRALAVLTARHEPLRTRFVCSPQGEPSQEVLTDWKLALEVVDLSCAEESERAAIIGALAARQVSSPFNLSEHPPARYLWIDLPTGQGLLLLTLHHIIVDGWSMDVLSRELRDMCADFARNEAPALPPLPIQYADYALWQRDWLASESAARQLDYWRARLADSSAVIALPFDRLRPEQRDYRGGVVRQLIPAPLVARLRTLADGAEATPYMILLTVFQILLHRLSDQTDFNVGTPIANRQRQETEGLIGLFVNTLVLRTQIREDDDFAALLARTRAEVLAAQDHQDMPFESLVQHLAVDRHPALNPLFQVLFSFQSAYEDTSLISDETWVSRFDLQVVFSESEAGLCGSWEYALALFDRDTVERFASQFICLLEGVIADVHTPLGRLRLGAGHDAGALAPLQDAYPRDASIEALFLEVSRANADRVALRCGDQTMSYRELAAAARRFARALASEGIAPGARIGISQTRGIPLVVTLLGTLMAGAAYVPLDPAYPAERLAYMAEDADVALVVTTRSSIESWQARGIKALDVEALMRRPELPVAINQLGGNRLAYIVYTSGSTGQPKGVAVPHRGVVRLVRNTNYCPLGVDTVMLECAPVAFDASTFELWGALLNGGQLIIYPNDVVDAAEIAALVRQHKINTAFLTSGLFNQWMSVLQGPTGLQWLLSGGEMINTDSVRRLYAMDADVCFVHCYGPTENTTFSTSHVLSREHDWRRTVPIGAAIAHSSFAVMDAAGQRVPVGVPGELWVGGDGVATGYWRRDDLTAERFTIDPLHPDVRMYRSGDIVRLDARGEVIFIGRKDNQVKIRGFRIELDEVRSMIMSLADVGTAVAAVRDSDIMGKQLVAWVVPNPGCTLSAEDLRARMRLRVPAFMLPSRFVFVDALPLNANGKVDLAALPAPDDAEVSAARVEPANDTELVIWEIWAALLDTRAFGVTDSFFDLGGHSLLAARVTAAIEQQFGQRIALRDLFSAPTVRELALQLDLAKWHSTQSDASVDADQTNEVGVI